MKNARIRKTPLSKAASPHGTQASNKKENKPADVVKEISRKLSSERSRQVPSGDVRMTANIRTDLHVKLKIVAAERRTTIGELIEELVERNL